MISLNKISLQKFIIDDQGTIFEAMKAINNNWREVVFVVEKKRRLVGAITDGDIRRGLLKGLKFDTKVSAIMSKSFISVQAAVDRAAVLDLMKANRIGSVPIVDLKKHLIGIHFLPDLIGASPRPNIALIMAGGQGKRLEPLTKNCPKPLVKVAGRPILERIILHLVGYGVKKIYISINYLGRMIEQYCGNGKTFGCEINYLKEKKFLGTGGALSLLPKKIKEPIIVINGDLVTQVNLDRLLKLHQQNKFVATMGVKPYQIEIPFGVIKNNKNRLIELHEKPINQYLINAGIYVINPEILNLVPRNQEFPITSLFENLLKKKKKTGIYVIEDDWVDVGRREDLRKASGES